MKTNVTLDITTTRTLKKLLSEVRAAGADLILTDLTDAARDSLERSGLMQELGEDKVKRNVGEAARGNNKD